MICVGWIGGSESDEREEERGKRKERQLRVFLVPFFLICFS